MTAIPNLTDLEFLLFTKGFDDIRREKWRDPERRTNRRKSDT